ncbi:hypothetical protein PACTADRAFT_48760 [Pachysolen tannophilus NRRL Y-2460]|uniref:protein-tyrosine-phosphatase n=1 Tax=Pachysolen tannophilus NRRL Y-2460 TaxID=669874 RepID=A0A1E4TZ14_PACTA|nr:hypothetical protein PACTADRAFT_48760 [Pachysolen tannophilus NRRL Y-2460]
MDSVNNSDEITTSLSNTQQRDGNNIFLRASPKKPRNMKNLSLDLSNSLQGQMNVDKNPITDNINNGTISTGSTGSTISNNNNNSNTTQQTTDSTTQGTAATVPVAGVTSKPLLPTSITNSETNFNLPFRHPSLSKPAKAAAGSCLKRTTTLALTMPEFSVSKTERKPMQRRTSTPVTTSSSFNTSASSMLPTTPVTFYSSSMENNLSKEEYHEQTIVQSFNNINIGDISDEEFHIRGAYPNGPSCVLEPNLFLYSEPSLEQILQFDVVINVAKEIRDYSNEIPTTAGDKKLAYYFVPWTHTSKLCPDLPHLTSIIEDSLEQNKKILIHCQCGVSRSASLVVAYFMKANHLNLNDAYNEVKSRAPSISPNMSLIFQLMEWDEVLHKRKSSVTSYNSNLTSPASSSLGNSEFNGSSSAISALLNNNTRSIEAIHSPI